MYQYGSTPLLWAARKGHDLVCEALLKAEANPDFVGMVPHSTVTAFVLLVYTTIQYLQLAPTT